MSEPVSRLTVIDHLAEVILNYISVKQNDEQDAADAKRQAEDIAELILRSMQFEIIIGPTPQGKVRAVFEILGPDNFQ
jgi:hypothetical protein